MKRRSSTVQLSKEQLDEAAREHLVTGDLFSFAHPVIPIKTRARWYGALSRGALERGAKLPELALGTAKFVDPYIFVALWGDEGQYTPELISDCAAAAFDVGATLQLEKVVLPVLGGKEGMKYLWAAERGVLERSDALDEAGRHVPEHVFVTDKRVEEP